LRLDEMENLFNSIKSAALSVGEKFVPILKESKFKETGVLTPEEFIIAGDYLTHHFPTWSWSKAVNSSYEKDYMTQAAGSNEKQFLITRRVPCYRRCAQLQYDPQLELIIKDEHSQEEWVDTHFYSTEFTNEARELPSEKSQPIKETPIVPDEDEEDEAPMDMDDFMAADEAEDPNCFKPPTTQDTEMETEDNVLKTRTYDLYITYDKYYQVPRFWLVGYNENGKPLSVDQMYEDFSADHANKTITIEAHPGVNQQMASIHPCRHAEVMKRLIEQCAESGKELEVTQYLVIFLKFVQTIIPTIEYDFTKSIQL